MYVCVLECGTTKGLTDNSISSLVMPSFSCACPIYRVSKRNLGLFYK